MDLVIAVDDPRIDDVRTLLDRHLAFSRPGSPLGRLLAVAADRGYQRVSLETGTIDAFAPARSLYTTVGFKPCAPFGEYTDNPYSAYMTIDLAEAAGGRRQTRAE